MVVVVLNVFIIQIYARHKFPTPGSKFFNNRLRMIWINLPFFYIGQLEDINKNFRKGKWIFCLQKIILLTTTTFTPMHN